MSRDVCVFCEKQSRLTREHIFASWIDALYPDIVKMKSGTRLERGDSVKEYQIEPFEQKIKAVCGTCNNGWMNQMENAVAPKLGPMIRDGAKVRLRPPAQKNIASWATKTALVLQHLNPTNTVIPGSEHRKFYAVKEPLGCQQVFIGFRASFADKNGVPQLFSATSQRIDTVQYQGENLTDFQRSAETGIYCMYRVTFAIGHVAFLLIGHTIPRHVRITIPRGLARVICQIWPVGQRTYWPPEPIESIGGIEALHHSFR